MPCRWRFASASRVPSERRTSRRRRRRMKLPCRTTWPVRFASPWRWCERTENMLKQIEGSRATAEGIALCRPHVICAYPITPQTHIVEGLSELVKTEQLKGCEFINVESEFAALSVAIGS